MAGTVSGAFVPSDDVSVMALSYVPTIKLPLASSASRRIPAVAAAPFASGPSPEGPKIRILVEATEPVNERFTVFATPATIDLLAVPKERSAPVAFAPL